MPEPLLHVDRDRFLQVFGRTSMPVTHELADHPLLTLEAVAGLAQKLPSKSIEHNLGDVPLVATGHKVASLDDDPAEIVKTIEANGSWMVLKNVEQDERYRALLDELLDQVKPIVGSHEGGMLKREAFIFVSAPGSITPSHVDPEHNFLLQVKGTKDMNVGAFDNPKIEQHELERFYGGGHRNIEQTPDQLETYALKPGDGVYVRPNAPHYVVNGDSASVSLSITWRTPKTDRASAVHRANGRLRRLGIKPAPPGRRERADRLKQVVVGRVDHLIARRRGDA